MAYNTLDIVVEARYLRPCDKETVENKLVLQFQRIISQTESKCDVQIVRVDEDKARNIVRFTLQFSDAEGSYAKEKRAVDNALKWYADQDSTLSLDADVEIPFTLSRSCNTHRQETSRLLSSVPTTSRPNQQPESRMASYSRYDDIHLQSGVNLRLSPPSSRITNQTLVAGVRSNISESRDPHAYQEGATVFQHEASFCPTQAETGRADGFEDVFNSCSISSAWNAPSQVPITSTINTRPSRPASMPQRPQSRQMTESRRSVRVPSPHTSTTLRDGSSAVKRSKQCASVDVSGYVTASVVKLYFTKQAKSVGTVVDDFVEDDRKKIINITFTDGSVLQTILKKTHTLEGKDLVIVQAPRRKPRAPLPVDKRRLILTGIPHCDDEVLSLFILARTKVDEDPIIMHNRYHEGVALVSFNRDIDVDNAIRNFAAKPFKGAIIKAESVIKSDSILVSGIPEGTHRDTIQYFFDSAMADVTQSVEDYVYEVKILPQGQAVVSFNDHTHVDLILSMKLPKLNDIATLHLEPWYDNMMEQFNAPPTTKRQLGLLDSDDKMDVDGIENVQGVNKITSDLQIVDLEELPREKTQRGESSRTGTKHKRPKTKKGDHEEIMSIPENLVAPLQQEMQNVGSTFTIHVSSFKGSITKYILRGEKENVMNAKRRIETLIRDLEQEDGYATPEEAVIEVPPLQPYRMKQLEMCRIKDKIQRNHPSVKIKVLVDQNKVQFEGNESAVTTARLNMMELFESLFQGYPNVNQHQQQFIIRAHELICETFLQRNVRATCVESGKVTVKAETETDAQRACQFLEDEIKYEKISCADETKIAVLLDEEGKTFLQSLNAELHYALVLVNAQTQCAEIAGFREDVQTARERVDEYVEANIATSSFVRIPENKVRYLQKLYGTDEIFPSVIPAWTTGDSSGVMLKGKKEDCEKGRKKILDEVKQIREKPHPVSRAGVCALLNDRSFLKPIEEANKSSIEFIGTENPSEEQHQSVPSGRQRPQVVKRYRIRTGQTIEVCLGDLTKEDTDVIVNAANSRMKHGGGVAGDIVRAGGQSIQDECDQIMRRKGHVELSTAQLVVTDPGVLSCKKIVHVVGPVWEGGNKNEEDLLFDCIANVHEEANKLGLTSIAIPAVSSGIFKFPVNLCAELMIQSTCEYYGTQSSVPSVHTIRFTDISDDICQKLTTLLDESPYTEGLASGGYPSGHAEEMASGMPQTTMSLSQVSHDTIRTSSGGTIRWKVGNIANEKVDSLVTSVGELADLSQGAVSAAILEKAGHRLQREVSHALAGNSLGDWEHVTTRSYNLQCREVYHIHCPFYHFSLDQTKKFVQAMLKLMRAANNIGMTSIAFPAIGAGKLNFPANIIAEVMYEAAVAFFISQTRGSLKEIRFVLFKTDTKNIKAFEAEMQNVLQRGATGQFEFGAQRTSGAGLRPELKASSNDTGKTYTSFQEESNGVCRMRIGNMFVELCKGSIVDANTDVIVNSTNEKFALGAPLSQHIINVGGNTIKQECQQLGRGYLLQHGFAMTSAGNFPHTKNVIHFMTNRHTDRVTDLKERIQKTLKKAEESRMKSIAFPAIGTGNPDWKSQKLAEAMFKAIGHFAVTNPQHLLLVKIVVYQGSLLPHYKTEMQSVEGKCYDLNRKAQMRRRFGKLKQKCKWQGSIEVEADTVEQPDTVVFNILAKSDEAIDDTIQGIESFISTEFMKEEISYDKNCGPLTPERQRRIKAVARANQTTIDCLAKEFNKSSRLIIRGKKQNVNDTKLGLLHLLNQLQSEEKKRVEQEALKQKIQWRYQDEFNQYQAYDADINSLIEEAYQKKQRYVEMELEDTKLKIDFQTMEETSVSSQHTSKVYRVDLMKEAVDRLPLHWDPSQRHHAVIDLVKGSNEYDKVQETFYKSLRSNQPRGWTFALGAIAAGSGKFEVRKIQRIQNVELWKQYMAKKDSMSAFPRRSQQDLERELFHGTSHEAIKDINKTGFNRSYHGKNGQAYGRGTYFATSATYSGRFAQPDQQGNRCMYLCKVLTGNFTKGDESMIVPPAKTSTEKYDSVVDNPQNPSIFVVFYDAQAYPEYLITFRDV